MNVLERLSEQGDNAVQLDTLKTEFSRYFRFQQYDHFPSLPIVSNEDPTVQFVGSSTNVFKKLLLAGCDRLAFTIQPCFRARNSYELLDEHSPFKWGSLFTMFGTIGGPDTYSQQCNDIFCFLTEVIGFRVNQLCLQAHPADHHLLQNWGNIQGLALEIGEQPETYYRWKYGEENISGKGVSLALISPRSGKPCELGNIIEISRQDQPIAIEMGFGLECLLTRFEDKDHTIEKHRLASLFSLADNHWRKYADSIMVSMTLIQNGVKPNARGQGRVLREYIKGIVYSMIKQNISPQQLADTLLKIERAAIGSNIGIASELYNHIFDTYDDLKAICLDLTKQTNEEIVRLFSKK